MPTYAPLGGNPLPGGINPQDVPGGDLGRYYLNYEPEAGFWRYLMQSGLGQGLDPVSRFAQNQYGRTYNQYQQAAAEEPNLGFFDFLERQKPDFGSEYRGLSPEARGDFSSSRLTPKARFIRAY